MRIILILFSILLVNSVVAEPKQLICTSSSTGNTEHFDKYSKEYADSMETSKRFKGYAEACRQAPFGWKEVFTFDTDQLKSSVSTDVETQSTSCHMGAEPVVKAQMSATTSVISFRTPGERRLFNIDRKTLEAGYDTERDHKCKLEDVDTSENLI
jgi:hypothetical protein